MMKFSFDQLENIVGKGENAGDQCFLKAFSRPFLWSYKNYRLFGEDLNKTIHHLFTLNLCICFLHQ